MKAHIAIQFLVFHLMVSIVCIAGENDGPPQNEIENADVVIFANFSGDASADFSSLSNSGKGHNLNLNIQQLMKGDVDGNSLVSVAFKPKALDGFLHLALSVSKNYNVILLLQKDSKSGILTCKNSKQIFYVGNTNISKNAAIEPNEVIIRVCRDNLRKISEGRLFESFDFPYGNEFREAIEVSVIKQSVNGLLDLSAENSESIKYLKNIGEKSNVFKIVTLTSRLRLGDESAFADMKNVMSMPGLSQDVVAQLDLAYADGLELSNPLKGVNSLIIEWPGLGEFSKIRYLGLPFTQSQESSTVLRLALSDPSVRVRYHGLKAIYRASGESGMPSRGFFEADEKQFIEGAYKIINKW